MAKNISWDSRITWYLMNDPQIMDYTDEDFERTLKKYALFLYMQENDLSEE